MLIMKTNASQLGSWTPSPCGVAARRSGTTGSLPRDFFVQESHPAGYRDGDLAKHESDKTEKNRSKKNVSHFLGNKVDVYEKSKQ